MKRRSFLQAVGGAIAAVIAPVVAAEQVKRLIAFPPPRLAMSLQEYNRVRPRFIFEPETLAELRAAIESRYETVHELGRPPYDYTIAGFGAAEKLLSADSGFFYGRGAVIAGEGSNEKEAVADAFNKLDIIGGKEMMWRVVPQLNRFRDFESNRSGTRVRARLLVLR